VAKARHLAPPVVDKVLPELEAGGRLLHGAFTPGRAGIEWVDAEVLRAIKRRSLAELRGEIEPVDEEALGRFLAAWQGVGQDRTGRSAALEVLNQLQGAEIPASVLERDVLSSRLTNGGPLLDQLMLEGEVVWLGRGSLGARDGKVALFARSRLPDLYHPHSDDIPDDPLHDQIRAFLADRGASFFSEIYAGVGGGDPEVVLTALWDLVWAGEVTNDTLGPLRAFISRRGRAGNRRSLPSSFPPHAAGRWSLVSALLAMRPGDTERSLAWASQLLDRHGVVTRGSVLAEGLPGGFSGLYPVLTEMEQTGRIRRGYFIEHQGGAQFASPGAVDRLRSTESTGIVVLAAADPANAFGAALPWPELDLRLARVAGAYVILHDGALAGYVERGGRTVHLWDDVDPDDAAEGLSEIAARHSRFSIEQVNQEPVARSSLSSPLEERGFIQSTRGLTWRKTSARR